MHAPALARIGLLLLLLPLAGPGCRPANDAPDPPRLRLPPPPPAAARFLIEAQHAFRQGNWQVALALTDSAEHQAPPDHRAFRADVAFLRGRIYGDLNQVDQAVAAYEQVLALDPTYRGARLNLGNLAFRRGRLREALTHYREELAVQDDPRVRVYMGHAYAELGRVDSARQAYEQALARNDSLAEAHIRLAVLLEDNGELEQALARARRALALKPNDPDYRYIAGNLLLQNGLLAEAEAELRRTIEQQPTHAKAHYSLSVALARQGRQDDAQRYLARVDSLRQLEESLDTFQRRTRLYPDDPAAWATYGYALYRAGRPADAIRPLQVALHLGPGNPDVHVLLANVYMSQRRPQDALPHYQAAVQQNPAMTDAWINLGICRARLGDPEGARQAWTKALDLAPNHPQIRQYLASLPPSP
ncbi:hypothetical protein AWN76_017275 [Rhodothermaceae bacterium RA]|nr:hypothetical protein AWN76_017275 [Rhodothermaceae bacterium RA]